MNPFFSKARVAAREDLLQKHIQKLASRLDEFATYGLVCPIGFAYTAMTMDIITELILDEPYGNLDQRNLNQGIMKCVQASGGIWRVAKHITWLMPVFARMPMWMVKMLDEKGAQFKVFQEVSSFDSLRHDYGLLAKGPPIMNLEQEAKENSGLCDEDQENHVSEPGWFSGR